MWAKCKTDLKRTCDDIVGGRVLNLQKQNGSSLFVDGSLVEVHLLKGVCFCSSTKTKQKEKRKMSKI